MGLLAGLLAIVLGIVQLILGLRVVARFFNLSSFSVDGTGFLASIYDWSAPLVAPFQSFLPDISLAGFVLDLPTVVAIIVYGAIGGLLIRLFKGR